MKRKIDKSKLEACKLVWKKRIAAEKGISEKCAEKTAQSCIAVSYTHLIVKVPGRATSPNTEIL